MAHFANMVEDAYYDDATYSTVTIIYTDHDKISRAHAVPADMNNTDFAFLVNEEGYDEAMLIKRTEVYKARMSRDVNGLINFAARQIADAEIEERLKVKIEQLNQKLTEVGADGLSAKKNKIESENKLLEAVQKASKIVDGASFDLLLENNESKDEIFKFKLWAMERPEIKDCTNDEKKELRKTDTLFGCLAKYHELTNK